MTRPMVLRGGEQCGEARLVQLLDPQLRRLLDLRTGVGPDDHVVHLLRDAPDDLAAGRLDAGLDGWARRGERAGDHERLALERTGRALADARADTIGEHTAQHVPVRLG